MTALKELFTNGKTMMTSGEFWKYALLGMQGDKADLTTDCLENYDTYLELYNEVLAITADSTEYAQGISEKGNGATLPGHTDPGSAAGFWMYKALNYSDIIMQAVDVYSGCRLDYYMLSLGRTTTSVSGALNTGVNLAWRGLVVPEEDAEIYRQISTAVTNMDKAAAGDGFGQFLAALLMTETPSIAI